MEDHERIRIYLVLVLLHLLQTCPHFTRRFVNRTFSARGREGDYELYYSYSPLVVLMETTYDTQSQEETRALVQLKRMQGLEESWWPWIKKERSDWDRRLLPPCRKLWLRRQNAILHLQLSCCWMLPIPVRALSIGHVESSSLAVSVSSPATLIIYLTNYLYVFY